MIKLPPAPAKFDELAEYNATVHRSVLVPAPEVARDAMRLRPLPPPDPDPFSPEHHARMARLQVEYRAWLYQALQANHDVLLLPEGGLVAFPKRQFGRVPWRVRLGLWWRGRA